MVLVVPISIIGWVLLALTKNVIIVMFVHYYLSALYLVCMGHIIVKDTDSARSKLR